MQCTQPSSNSASSCATATASTLLSDRPVPTHTGDSGFARCNPPAADLASCNLPHRAELRNGVSSTPFQTNGRRHDYGTKAVRGSLRAWRLWQAGIFSCFEHGWTHLRSRRERPGTSVAFSIPPGFDGASRGVILATWSLNGVI